MSCIVMPVTITVSCPHPFIHPLLSPASSPLGHCFHLVPVLVLAAVSSSSSIPMRPDPSVAGKFPARISFLNADKTPDDVFLSGPMRSMEDPFLSGLIRSWDDPLSLTGEVFRRRASFKAQKALRMACFRGPDEAVGRCLLCGPTKARR